MTKKQNKALQELIRNFKKEVEGITGAELTDAELDFEFESYDLGFSNDTEINLRGEEE